MEIENIRKDAENAMAEILEKAKLKEGDLFIVGCSSSEIIGHRMGTSKDGETDAAVEAVYGVISTALKERGINLAVQCCEHLNRAVVCERSVMEKYGFEQVNVIPQLHAGGAFAVKHFSSLADPVVVESVNQKADAGFDIGGVMIGMHLHPVVVPIRMEQKHIGEAFILAARHRPKYVGGERAVYDPELA
ncbi:MAG: TIGR01440 family protein [Lachnospiraceae bacterium]|nr:TIGR01440 family protein [Lachnospiraceae bacterium]